MDDEMQAIEIRDPELERRFAAFARLRLSPDAAAIARIRARVMREARLQHEAARIAAYVAPAVDARRRSIFRRAAIPLAAAAVWTAVAVGTIAAAQPGGGLYPARLWVERATLPSAADARVDADLANLDDRMSEALAAASVGDRGALAASLEAYAATADDATTTSAADPGLATRVEAALARHQAVLTALIAGLTTNGNDTALAAIERNLQRAIEHNAAVLDVLETRRGGAADGGASGSGAALAPGGAAGGTGGAAAGGGASGGSAAGGSNAVGSTAGGSNGDGDGAGSGPTAGGTSGTAGADKGTTTGGGGAEASQKPAGADTGNGNGGSGNDGDNSGSRPTDAPAPSPVTPDHSPRAGG